LTQFSTTRRVPHEAGQVLAIVADVGSYAEFMPLVRKAMVRNRREIEGGRRTFDAEVAIAFDRLGVSETLYSQVTVDMERGTVTALSEEGAVKSLKAVWTVTAEEAGTCTVQLSIDYVMRSRALHFLLSGLVDTVARRVMTAFEERAARLYSTSN
jgi:coenzyme Q-binding protein COQ10